MSETNGETHYVSTSRGIMSLFLASLEELSRGGGSKSR
jgi:hypothetical protein